MHKVYLRKKEELEPYKKTFLSLLGDFEKENRDFREWKMRDWKRKDLYWHNIQFVFWADDIGLFSSLTQGIAGTEFSEDEEEQILTRAINIYKAHGESIVAALSADIPSVKFYPEDADNIADMDAANSRSKISLIIRKRNNKW